MARCLSRVHIRELQTPLLVTITKLSPPQRYWPIKGKSSSPARGHCKQGRLDPDVGLELGQRPKTLAQLKTGGWNKQSAILI